jgi:hypothetical protein
MKMCDIEWNCVLFLVELYSNNPTPYSPPPFWKPSQPISAAKDPWEGQARLLGKNVNSYLDKFGISHNPS